MDLAEVENQAQFSDLVSMIAERELPYPLVAVNGQLRLAGSAHYYRVLPLIEEALATKDAA